MVRMRIECAFAASCTSASLSQGSRACALSASCTRKRVGKKMAAAGVTEEDDAFKKRKAHGMLKLYYGITEEGKGSEKLLEPTDIDGVHFNPELYLTKLRKESSLAQLMDVESDMVRQIRSLDSDMQTLVYENYNKFISATDTIRKMKNDFKKMEDEMDGLATNMAVITEFSATISSTLQERHQHITKLSGVHTLLRKLQFLFELPARLKKCIELGAYAQAVSYHSKARSVLHQYQHMPSFHGIQTDCQAIMAGLADTLRQRFRDQSSSPQELSECVELLLSLDEPAHLLCDEFLAHGRGRLASHLSDLGGADDVLEFVDRGCGGFISDSCLLAASYQALFCKEPGSTAQMAEVKLTKFLEELSQGYFELVEMRLRQERSLGDNSLLVRALDRFHRRLQAPSKLVPGCGFNRRGTEIVVRAAQERLAQYLQALKDFFQGCLTDVRQALAAPRVPGKEAPALGELLAGLSASVLNQIKTVLAAVHLFTAKDVAFSDKPYFKGEFCSQGVREGLIVAFIKSVCQTARQFCDSPGEKGASTPPVLLLLLSRLCLDYETSTISYILTLTDEQFLGQDHSSVTPVSSLCSLARSTAQTLLNQYVKSQGLVVSQMLRKSVETRDWVATIEPRNVRAVMKRVVEDITGVDVQVSILTGIIKISLKTFLECVRLRTFGRYGLQQIQVDCHYLQLYLWRFVSDENLVHCLLDEVVGSAAHRCLDPLPMEQSVIEVICERG
uniref:Vacuolar protein sorting-associated protein 51 homolog n=1 Tax=Leptobrachium leishanense TaxID=445787 RepID=A0A8C5R4B9_9ANUR